MITTGLYGETNIRLHAILFYLIICCSRTIKSHNYKLLVNPYFQGQVRFKLRETRFLKSLPVLPEFLFVQFCCFVVVVVVVVVLLLLLLDYFCFYFSFIPHRSRLSFSVTVTLG